MPLGVSPSGKDRKWLLDTLADELPDNFDSSLYEVHHTLDNTVQLIPKALHDAIGHTGGVAAATGGEVSLIYQIAAPKSA